MTKKRIPAQLRRVIVAGFGGRCAYCHSMTAITGAKLVIDHIIPEARGGDTTRDNLCLACHACNESKFVQTFGRDSASGDQVRLFHPRRHEWRDHFAWSEDFGRIIGRTAIGRATIDALTMNHVEIVEARLRWALVGWHPPEDDL